MMELTENRILEVFKAIQANDVSLIREFCETQPECIDVGGVGISYYRGKTPLMYSLESNRFEIARLLIDAGADVNAVMPAGLGWTILYASVYAGVSLSLEILQMLLERGADPNVKYGPLPLTRAIDNSWKLDKYHADAKAKDMTDTVTIKAVKLLLEYGANPDYKRPSGAEGNLSSAREHARKMPNVPDVICDLLEIPRKTPVPVVQSIPPILEHPGDQFANSYRALVEGFRILLVEQPMIGLWASISVQGGTEQQIADRTLYFKDRVLVFPRETLTDEMLSKCRVKVSPTSIEQDTTGNCKFFDTSTVEQMAAVIDVLATKHFKLRKFMGDYAIGFEWAPEYAKD